MAILREQIETALPLDEAFAFVADFRQRRAVGPGRRHVGADEPGARRGRRPLPPRRAAPRQGRPHGLRDHRLRTLPARRARGRGVRRGGRGRHPVRGDRDGHADRLRRRHPAPGAHAAGGAVRRRGLRAGSRGTPETACSARSTSSRPGPERRWTSRSSEPASAGSRPRGPWTATATGSPCSSRTAFREGTSPRWPWTPPTAPSTWTRASSSTTSGRTPGSSACSPSSASRRWRATCRSALPVTPAGSPTARAGSAASSRRRPRSPVPPSGGCSADVARFYRDARTVIDAPDAQPRHARRVAGRARLRARLPRALPRADHVRGVVHGRRAGPRVPGRLPAALPRQPRAHRLRQRAPVARRPGRVEGVRGAARRGPARPGPSGPAAR